MKKCLWCCAPIWGRSIAKLSNGQPYHYHPVCHQKYIASEERNKAKMQLENLHSTIGFYLSQSAEFGKFTIDRIFKVLPPDTRDLLQEADFIWKTNDLEFLFSPAAKLSQKLIVFYSGQNLICDSMSCRNLLEFIEAVRRISGIGAIEVYGADTNYSFEWQGKGWEQGTIAGGFKI